MGAFRSYNQNKIDAILNDRSTDNTQRRTALLYYLASVVAAKLSDKLPAILKMATELLGMEMGILSKIEQEKYTVIQCYQVGTGYSKGEVFELGGTYCNITYMADGVVGIEYCKESEYKGHPCYTHFGLEAYIGVPVWVHGVRYGTLNFSSSSPAKFTQEDVDFILFLSHWIGAAMERELREIELRKAKEHIEQASKAREYILSKALGHELRTPMNGVVGAVNLLDQTKLNSEQKELTSLIKDSSSKLLFLMDNIINFSKIYNGEIHIDESPFSVSNLLKELVATYKKRCEDKEIEFRNNIDLHFAHNMVGDSTKLKQILNHLLDNACQFTEKGSVQLKAEVSGQAEGKMELAFEVTDTGTSIPLERMRSLFDPFERNSIASERLEDGVGVSLAICRRLVELMGGTIRAENRALGGVTFRFTVVLRKGEEQKAGSSKEHFSVLLVEDNLINQKIALRMLKQLGYESDCAKDGVEAVSKTSEKDYDLIFMDMQMPNMDGVEATKLIRRRENAKQPLIVALTANALKSDRDACIEAGMDDFLTKPITLERMRLTIERWEERLISGPQKNLRSPSEADKL